MSFSWIGVFKTKPLFNTVVSMSNNVLELGMLPSTLVGVSNDLLELRSGLVRDARWIARSVIRLIVRPIAWSIARPLNRWLYR